MGSIRKRPDSGCLFVDFRYRGLRCREQTALSDNAANRKRLEKLLERIEADIDAGTFEYRRYFPASNNAGKFDISSAPLALAPPAARDSVSADPSSAATTPLFNAFAEIWFVEKQIEWRRSHRIGIRADLDRLLIPQFGEKEVGRITKADVLAYRAQLARVPARGKTSPLSNNRINRILNPLRQILNEAADRHDFRSPFQNIRQLKVRKSDVDPFTLDEVRRILETVRKDFRNYYTTRFFTGMRTGEVDGLKWKYIDFEKRLIMVRETIVLGEEEYTKTDSSQREIQMTQIVFDALQAQEAATRKVSPYVFCNRDGNPLDHKNVTQRVWYPLLRHLGLKPRRPYQCRHTAATLWLASGENPEWIARQLGHSTTEMLFRTYSRFVPNLTRRDGSAFERLLTGALGGGERQIQMLSECGQEMSHG
ncbi:MAG TPA: site-specific integrase [Rhodocyclaceae bacterium]|nr:site-specific integrase [Rhodocyclaceae bacterium]HNB80388.1 site-specific integrase [Rhodocyclaceae bacterium]HNC62799.1 site-specific integrase [Rhodocyclaceae bacterium]HNH14728.1 site-specific integrase [Rhodocyclaceae bacterium]HNI00579.1 site-specific integrase [Rhodocyclaceae bacterium]